MSAAQNLLAKLGINPDDTLSVAVGSPRRRRKIRANQIDTLIADRDVWWSINPTDPETAMATTKDVTRVAALQFELDCKNGSTMENSVATIKALTEAFGKVSAVVQSGGGLHVYIAVADGHITPGVFTHADAAGMAERLGRLVQRIAETHGAVADSVFDLTRLLRVPGSINTKYDPPRPVQALAVDGAAPYLRADILERLDTAEKQFPPPAPAPARPTAPARGGENAGADHPYITAAIDRELARLAQCPESGGEFGGRAAMLYRVALNLGCWRQLDRERLRAQLRAAANTCGLNEDPGCDIDATITNGFRDADAREPNRVPASTREPFGDTTLIVAPDPDDATPQVDRSHLPADEQQYQRRFDKLTAKLAPLEAELFGARESLQTIRSAALKYRAAPLATFGAVVTRILVQTPVGITINSEVTHPCSGNTFLNVCGRRGDGKDIAVATAEKLVDIGGIPDIAPASGEALAAGFWTTEADPDDEKKPVPVRRAAVLVRVNEISSMTKSAGRDGSILYPQLCAGYSGQKLGQERADSTKSKTVAAGTYRLCAIISAQPEMTGPLFEQQQGIAERWLWMPAASRETTAANRKAHRHMRVEALAIPSALDINRATQINGQVLVPESVTDELDAEMDRRVAGLVAVDEAHSSQTRLRVMWALALLDGRVQPNEDDWQLAGVVMDISTEVRDWCRGEADRAEQANENHRARRQGVAASVRNAAFRRRESTETHKAMVAAVGCMERRGAFDQDTAVNKRDIIRGVPSVHHDHLGAALKELRELGVVEQHPAEGGRGTRYWLIRRDWLESAA